MEDTWETRLGTAPSRVAKRKHESYEIVWLTGDTPTPPAPLKLQPRVPRAVFDHFKAWTMQDVYDAWPPAISGYTESDARGLLGDIHRVCSQANYEDGDHIVLEEWYRPPANGFPGSLHSASGLAKCVGAVRSNFLQETADMDMSSAQNRCVRFWCHFFDIPCKELDHILKHYNGRECVLQRLQDEMGVTKAKAKSLIIMAWTTGSPLRTSNRALQKIDKEAKLAQTRLISQTKLKFILPYTKSCNRAGSFISQLYHFTVSKLLLRVKRMFEDDGIAVAALVFDGLNIADKSLHGDKTILFRAKAACDEVFPGIEMEWEWKELDFVLKSKEKTVLVNADGSNRELRI